MSEMPGANWYPDPDVPGGLRYWNGTSWTEHRQPPPPPLSSEPGSAAQRNEVTLALGIGALGALIAIAGTFLPRAESTNVLTQIAENTLIQTGDGTGVGIIITALIGFGALYTKRDTGEQSLGAVIAGIVLVALAFYAGTGDRLELTSLAPGVNATEQASPGTGIWAVGVGGLLLALAGWRSGRS